VTTAARPALVFEVTKTIAAYTTDGLAPGGGLKVTVMPEAALQLQRALGVKLFSALFTLICMAGDDGSRLVVDTNASKLAEQLGCSRQKAGEMVTQLEQAGFLDREQVRGIGGRADRFGRGRYVLCPELYRAVERRQTLTHSERPLGDVPTVVTKADTGSEPTDVAKADTTSTGVAEADSGRRSAGRTGGRFSDTGVRSSLHEDGMNEDHSSLPTTDARLTPPSVAGLPAAEVVALLEQWGVFDAETVVRTADPAALDAALREISARFGEIKNPGAYLRRLLAGSPPAPQQPRPVVVVPAPEPIAAPEPTAAPAPAPVADEPAGRRLPEVTGEQLVAVYAGLAPEARAEVDRALGRMADVAGAGWCHVPTLIRPRRLYLVGVLERLGLLDAAG
jgi:DNA-binding Lrp family transcriptional regulator